MAFENGKEIVAKDNGRIFCYDGELNEDAAGWEMLYSEEGKMVYVPFEGHYLSKGGRIQSQIISFDGKDKTSYCNLKFNAKTSDQCLWWVDFFDKNGNPLPDVNSSVYPDCDDNFYDQMIYVQRAAESMRVAFQFKSGLQVKDVSADFVSSQRAAKWCDEQYAELPPLNFSAPSNSFELLPKTAEALNFGKPWRVVMLGDSVQNDSFNSIFQALVKRDFPDSMVDFIISVRGSTGCGFYKDVENFCSYVTSYNPDLLLIGGISNFEGDDQKDVDDAKAAISQVIKQAKELGCEIVLLSPPHSVDWRSAEDVASNEGLPETTWSEETTDPKGRRLLRWSPFEQVALENGISFWNMTSPTADYIASSEMPYGYFNRDYVHNNDRGKQIIGRVLQQYFSTAKFYGSSSGER